MTSSSVVLESGLTCPCSNLSRRRYAQNDETLYVAPEDERTDYVRGLFSSKLRLLTLECSHNRQWQTGTMAS